MIPRVCSRPYRGFRRSLCLPRLGQSHENLEYAAAYVLQNKELKQNLPILLKYIGVLVAVVVMFTVVFPFTMLNAEGEEHSWITGLYWTLTVMSMLGFGNITFQTDSGRLFSVIVLSYSTLGEGVDLLYARTSLRAAWQDAGRERHRRENGPQRGGR
jgi:hypothetical protein